MNCKDFRKVQGYLTNSELVGVSEKLCAYAEGLEKENEELKQRVANREQCIIEWNGQGNRDKNKINRIEKRILQLQGNLIRLSSHRNKEAYQTKKHSRENRRLNKMLQNVINIVLPEGEK